jgi:uncharacterized Ntn-hydrolase superfamily protein
MTFSVAGWCQRTGMVGVAITTSSICVGARCPWVQASVGAVSTQNVTLPSLGPMILERIQGGADAKSALDQVMAGPVQADYRQVTVVDARGQLAHFTGSKTLGTHAVATGAGCVAAGNLLSHDAVPAAMIEIFQAGADRHLGDRLLGALEAGVAAGGEQGPTHSAALLVAHEQPWPLVDLRVDWDDGDPVARLRRLWTAYEPQMQDYVTRALDPASAPSYGVPGDP